MTLAQEAVAARTYLQAWHEQDGPHVTLSIVPTGQSVAQRPVPQTTCSSLQPAAFAQVVRQLPLLQRKLAPTQALFPPQLSSQSSFVGHESCASRQDLSSLQTKRHRNPSGH